MSLLLIGAGAAALFALITWIGPFLVRTAAPVLMRAPRLAVFGLLSVPLMWWAVVAALSLLAASLFQGPDVLPVPLADVCSRCLIAASPFPDLARVETLIPVVLFLVFPLLVSVFSVVWGLRQRARRRRENSSAAARLLRGSTIADINGRSLNVLDKETPFAFSLPHKYGGVVVSQALCSSLEKDELTAVLEHERAHVEGGHHRIMAIIDTFVRPLSFIPLFAEVAASIPLYLEIAADDRARRTAGTPALASALLKIGQPTDVTGHLSGSYALNIAGPDRIRQLVSPADMTSGVLPVMALASVLAAFVTVFSSVFYSYATVLATGCVMP
ncbi:Zn-dependent protease with chaperone function [Brevibacterium sandarakinum]|uniref:Zn-dependent protease with chaperone function n=1 Tax=Brevibacterium sandarakinum TaxID=629680 RepID=A0A1H1UU99_BRESA|nr:M56 family metallopeptidase [Brevibacterium sandarakinum]SDS75449.1 Zn-dependent protease with chaperone function [Brevibacterium sandarakinum]